MLKRTESIWASSIALVGHKLDKVCCVWLSGVDTSSLASLIILIMNYFEISFQFSYFLSVIFWYFIFLSNQLQIISNFVC